MICSVPKRLRGILPPGRDTRILPLGLERFQGGRSLHQALTPWPGRVPVSVRAVIVRCLEKTPSDRYQRLTEVRAGLGAIRHHAVLGSWATWKYLLFRRPGITGVGATVAVLIVGTILGVNVGGLREGLFGQPEVPLVRTIAVPPLENLTGDPAQNSTAGSSSGTNGMMASDTAADNPAAEVAGALGVVLGSLLGGGELVDPIDIELLNPLVPETFAGLRRTSSDAEKTGFGVIMVSTAEATYDDGAGRSATLEITDTGGVSGLMDLASWTNGQEESQSDDGYERTRQVDGRLTHEKSSRSGDDEFAVVVADRFLVAARGRGIDVDALRTAVSGLDLDGLESMAVTGTRK